MHSEAENLIVPIHAYPVVNDVLFPVRVDFGKCANNEVYSKTVRLECKVPIQFEYEITSEEDTSGGALSIEPNKGLIPADGFIEVCAARRSARPRPCGGATVGRSPCRWLAEG